MLILLGVIAYRYGWRTAGIGWTITWGPLASLGAFDGSTALGDGLLFALVMAGVAAAPVAFGRYRRGVRSAADVAQERVVEAEAWRHVETRAARLAERSRLARDLHDIVAHHVGAMTLRASSARLALDTAGDVTVAAAALGDIAETGRHVLDELRGLLVVLRDPEAIDEEALLTEPKAAIADAVSRVRGAGVPVTLHVDSGLARTSLVVRTTVARIVQEALTNVLKHAGPGTATRLTVDVEWPNLRLRIDNDAPAGQPPAPATLPISGHGLAGMRDRVAVLGGVLTAGPTGEGGWSVVVDLPTVPALPAQAALSAQAALPAPVEAGGVA
jgi:signal transduction histidine kinase